MSASLLSRASLRRDQDPRAVPAPFALAPRRLGIVARDWWAESRPGTFVHDEITPHVPTLTAFCSEKRCDTVLFALWTHCARKAGSLTKTNLFPLGSRHLAVLAGEVFDCKYDEKGWSDERVVVAHRGRRGVASVRLRQRFARSTDGDLKKEALLADLPARTFGSTLVMLCGEVNIISTKKATGSVVDEYGFRRKLDEDGIRVILNPAHTYSSLHWLRLKRSILSREERTVVTVWNAGAKDSDPQHAPPWLIHRDGKPFDEVVEVEKKELPVQGIRIGIVDLP